MRFFYFCFFWVSICEAQILDDSTHQVYGNGTVNYWLEADLLNNASQKHSPDTLLMGFHKSDLILKSNWMYQDLGNVGTAQKPLFYSPSFQAETPLGYDSFRKYAPQLKDVKYYNTKSPYTLLAYTQGFKGFSELEFRHSQNLNPRLNITLNVLKFNASKQIDATSSEEKLTDHWSYYLSSNYSSKNKKYDFLAAFYHFNHLQNEQGGILEKKSVPIQPRELMANYRSNYDSQLDGTVFSREKWNNVHLYHQFKFKNGFQAFQIVDINRQKYFFTDLSFSVNKTSKSYNLDTTGFRIDTTLRSKLFFRTYTNQIGFKGRYKGFDYRIFSKQRFYQLETNFADKMKVGLKAEMLVGGQAAYYFNDSTNNLVLETEANFNNAYYFSAKLRYKGFEGELYNARVNNSLFIQSFYNKVFNWDSLRFENPKEIFVYGSYVMSFKKLSFKPGLRTTILTDYTYLNANLKPSQYNKGIRFITLEAPLAYNSKKISISNQFLFSLFNSDSLYRAPKVVNTTNVEFHLTYARVLKVNIGLDVYYKSKYKADAYHPIIQQFYLQNDFYVWGYAVVDPYLSFNINKVRLAFKFSHINQGLPILKYQGMYTSPYYLAMPRAFLLKVNWPLFD
jgi:Putative porin